MATAVLLAVGGPQLAGDDLAGECAARLRGAGRKVRLVASAAGCDALGAAPELAAALGLPAAALAAGCPVPFAGETDVWDRVSDACAAAGCDAVVVAVGSPAAALALATAPERLHRVAQAVLDDIGPSGERGQQVLALLDVDRRCHRLGELALGEVTSIVEPDRVPPGERAERRALALLGLRRTPVAEVVSVLDGPQPGPAPLAVRRSGSQASDGFVWSLDLDGARAEEVELWLERSATGTWLELRLAGLSRAVPLPAALHRCTVSRATVSGGRLEVTLDPDPALWRLS